MHSHMEEVLSRLTLFPLSKLKPHEESRQEMVHELARSISSRGILIDPIIVDEGSSVVLDGTHRLMALRLLGLERAPVYLVDLKSRSIVLGRWFRGLATSEDIGSKMNLGKPLDRDAVEAVNRRERSYAIVTSKACYLSEGRPADVWSAYRQVRTVDMFLECAGLKPTFIPDSLATSLLGSKISAFVHTFPVTKEEVVVSALSEKLLPHKTTRHIVDGRPIRLNLSLKWLRKNLDEQTAIKAFQKHLGTLAPKVLPGGSVIGGRLYQESLTVLNE